MMCFGRDAALHRAVLVKQRTELFRKRVEIGLQLRDLGASHAVILTALITGDANKAEATVREHLQSIWEHVKIWPLA